MSVETILTYVLCGILSVSGIGILLIFLCVKPKSLDKKDRVGFVRKESAISKEGMDFE